MTIAQKRVPTAREVFPALTDDGQVEFTEQLVDLDPLLFNGKVRSAFTRAFFYGTRQRELGWRYGSDLKAQIGVAIVPKITVDQELRDGTSSASACPS